MRFEKELLLEEFNPEVIMNSGQVFRLFCDASKNAKKEYTAFSGENKVRFSFDEISLKWVFDCKENQWDFWQRYFDFDIDYKHYNALIIASKDKFLTDALQCSRGMRILRQDLWEVYVSYLISQNNNIPRIKNSIEKLCKYYTDGCVFPSAELLAKSSAPKLSQVAGLGYRAEYIFELAQKVSCGEFDLLSLEKMTYSQALERLLSLKGIGPKVANCILLYGYHFLDSYPIDTWMKRIIKEDYNSMNTKDYLDYVRNSFAGFEGYVQQLQFYYKRIINLTK